MVRKKAIRNQGKPSARARHREQDDSVQPVPQRSGAGGQVDASKADRGDPALIHD